MVRKWLAEIRACSTTSWMRSISGIWPANRWESTLTTWAVSRRASSSPKSPVAAPARRMAEKIFSPSKETTVPSRLRMRTGTATAMRGARTATGMPAADSGSRVSKASPALSIGSSIGRILQKKAPLGADAVSRQFRGRGRRPRTRCTHRRAGSPSREAPVANRPRTGFTGGVGRSSDWRTLRPWAVLLLSATSRADRPQCFRRRSFSLTAAGQSRSRTGFPLGSSPGGDEHRHAQCIETETAPRQRGGKRRGWLVFTQRFPKVLNANPFISLESFVGCAGALRREFLTFFAIVPPLALVRYLP